MSTNKLVASKENMEFFFELIQKSEDEIVVFMYNTTYSLIKEGEGWISSSKNKFHLTPSLIEAVIKAIHQKPPDKE